MKNEGEKLGLETSVNFESQGRSIVCTVEELNESMFRDFEMDSRERTKRYVLEIFENSYKYVDEIIPTLMSVDYLAQITKRERHAAEGSLMRLSVDSLKNGMEDADEDIRNRSQIAHELLHNLFYEEFLPMFIELIFLKESGGFENINSIEESYATGLYNEQENEAYLAGLEEIKNALGCNSIKEIFEKLKDENLVTLKEIFKKKVLEELEKQKIEIEL